MMVRQFKALFLIMIMSSGINAFQSKTLTAEEQILGGSFKFKVDTLTPFLPVGCLDHRTLMFIVHEIEGSDPKTAHMLAERDCRPLMKDTEYIRCGPGGYAHPNKGEPLTYSAYCRKGVKDLQLYTLDIQMNRVK